MNSQKSKSQMLFLALILSINAIGQKIIKPNFLTSDTLIIVTPKADKGFNSDYILFIPKGTVCDKQTTLLVEPNNTGQASDSMEMHRQSAIHLARNSSVGHDISTELKIPLLVPIFPRPLSKPFTYTHALDRDVLLEKSKTLKRLDIQLVRMIEDAKVQLGKLNVVVEDKVFMNGFSASATFTNRFVLMHPKIVKAAAMGGLNGVLILPVKKSDSLELNYPIGINDFDKVVKSKFDKPTYQAVPQFIYMGALDDNDAVQFDDAYDEPERKIINSVFGDVVQKRWISFQEKYRKENLTVVFKTYTNVGHWTDSKINSEVTLFFQKYL
jgi:hypothetical protein